MMLELGNTTSRTVLWQALASNKNADMYSTCTRLSPLFLLTIKPAHLSTNSLSLSLFFHQSFYLSTTFPSFSFSFSFLSLSLLKVERLIDAHWEKWFCFKPPIFLQFFSSILRQQQFIHKSKTQNVASNFFCNENSPLWWPWSEWHERERKQMKCDQLPVLPFPGFECSTK